MLPEVLAAAAELADEGIAAHVVDVTSADRLYRAWQRTLRQGVRTATAPSVAGRAARRVPRDRAPDRHRARRRLAHAELARLGARGARGAASAWTASASPGAVADLYRAHDLDSGSIVNAALAALSLP